MCPAAVPATPPTASFRCSPELPPPAPPPAPPRPGVGAHPPPAWAPAWAVGSAACATGEERGQGGGWSATKEDPARGVQAEPHFCPRPRDLSPGDPLPGPAAPHPHGRAWQVAVAPSDWRVRGVEPSTAPKPGVGLHCPPGVQGTGTGSHTGRPHTHTCTALLYTCAHVESRLQPWPAPMGPPLIVSLLPATPQPAPPRWGNRSTFVSSGIRSLCPRAFLEARGTEEPAPGPGSALGKWVQEPSPCQDSAGHALHRSGLQSGASARGTWLQLLLGTLGSTAQPRCPCTSPPLTASLGTWPRQVSVAARAVIAPVGRWAGAPLGLAQGQGGGRGEPAALPNGRRGAPAPREPSAPGAPEAQSETGRAPGPLPG